MSEPTSNAAHNNKIHYIEFTTNSIERTKQFYNAAFGWTFEDWGPDYASFSEAGISGGFMKGESEKTASNSGPLVVLYASDLAAAEQAVLRAGGSVTVPIFNFPGGRRFHFSDGAGNVLAAWSE